MKDEFFYSKSTGLYVSRNPLQMDSRVKRAAEKSGVRMSWDEGGRINFIDFDNAKKLLETLDSVMISPAEYWKVLEDAKKAKDKEMLECLTSSKYCEWLDRVYLNEGVFIDHPKLIGKYEYSGKKQKSVFPFGRPGWFDPKRNINSETGLPKRVEAFREKFDTSWKYWSPDFSVTRLKTLAPVRGYVTSVGKPSLDLGIPVDSKQPVLMIRECRVKPLEPIISANVLIGAKKLLKNYEELSRNLRIKNNYTRVYRNLDACVSFLSKHGSLFVGSKELAVHKLREQFFNLLGLLKIIALSKNDTGSIKKIDDAASTVSTISIKQLSYKDFLTFIKSSRERLKCALEKREDIAFVMGHKNPDADTTISSLFEAWRNSILDKGSIVYIPVIQNHNVPDEAKHLLGEEISESILLVTEEAYEKAKKAGTARWISVDQNREPEVQKNFISIIDHHIASEVAKLQNLPKTLEMTGSCTALIVQKTLGMGLYFDKTLSRMLYGATLMDTENRVKHKMTVKDALIMDYLKNVSETTNDDELYTGLMSFLLNTDDPEVLFKRDYKEDWGFGFAVAKIKNGFDKKGYTLKKDLIKKAVTLAEQNNAEKNLPLTALRITDYEENNKTVNRERVYLVFNKSGSKEFKDTVFELLEKIVRFEFENINLRRTKEFVEFWGTGIQLSRKKTAPVLEPIIKVFNEHFYSASTKLWVNRDFLKKTCDTIRAAKKMRINFSTDQERRINYITYPEARALAKNLGFSILSLKEYWLVLNDAKKMRDIQMINSLTGSNFVEFLDTLIKDYKYIIEHPIIKKEEKDYVFTGKKMRATIPKGKPGLIHPEDIDLKTGIPKRVRKPNEYGNPELWRYWEPDAEIVIPVRSYIFLLKQPCWDGKFHITDNFSNLGIRPCCRKVIPPKIKITADRKKLKIKIKKQGDTTSYSLTKTEGVTGFINLDELDLLFWSYKTGVVLK
ncbi:hypothetical protein FJZ53_04410 [Candidatus Woesearchaeota archaeon]|nr:hypothetical protein [Candidatus Woesearchaeota archaeon]